jgi:hypothetical protein
LFGLQVVLAFKGRKTKDLRLKTGSKGLSWWKKLLAVSR